MIIYSNNTIKISEGLNPNISNDMFPNQDIPLEYIEQKYDSDIGPCFITDYCPAPDCLLDTDIKFQITPFEMQDGSQPNLNHIFKLFGIGADDANMAYYYDANNIYSISVAGYPASQIMNGDANPDYSAMHVESTMQAQVRGWNMAYMAAYNFQDNPVELRTHTFYTEDSSCSVRCMYSNLDSQCVSSKKYDFSNFQNATMGIFAGVKFDNDHMDIQTSRRNCTVPGTRIYYLRFYENGKMVREYVPVLKWDPDRIDPNNNRSWPSSDWKPGDTPYIPCFFDTVTRTYAYGVNQYRERHNNWKFKIK